MFANYEALLLALLLSLLSGTGVFLHSVREQRITPSFFNLVTEWVVAMVAGVTGFYIGVSQGWQDGFLYVAVLIASNNGREVVSEVKNRFIRVINSEDIGPKK